MSQQQTVLSREDCVEHDLYWIATARTQQAQCCKRCGYAFDQADGREVRSELVGLTPPSGLPDGLYRTWMPKFPLEYL